MEVAIVVLLLVGFVTALIAAERSLRRQAGSGIKRSKEEQQALSHIQTNSARSAGGGGGV
jgi:hypothetical protein